MVVKTLFYLSPISRAGPSALLFVVYRRSFRFVVQMQILKAQYGTVVQVIHYETITVTSERNSDRVSNLAKSIGIHSHNSGGGRRT